MAGIARVRYRSLFTLHVTQQRAHCPTHIEASTMALASRKENALLQGWPARKGEAGLRSVYTIWGLLKLLGIRGGQAGEQTLWQAGFHQRALNLAICGKVLQRGFQHQIFLYKGPLTSERALVRYCKGAFSTRSSYTKDPSLLKGLWHSRSSPVPLLWFFHDFTLFSLKNNPVSNQKENTASLFHFCGYRCSIFQMATFFSVVFYSLGHVQLFAITRTAACQAPLSVEFSRQEYWGGLPFPTLPDPGMESTSLAFPVLAGGFITSQPPGKLHYESSNEQSLEGTGMSQWF